MKREIPIGYIEQRHKLTWAEIDLGLKEGWVSTEDIIELASSKIGKGLVDPTVSKIAAHPQEDQDGLRELVGILAGKEGTQQTEEVRLTWLRILLAWIYDNRAAFPYPLQMVEALYAEFGYPDEIYHLVPFNEPSDGYRPQDHTPEQNIARLMDMWGEYVKQHMSSRSAH